MDDKIKRMYPKWMNLLLTLMLLVAVSSVTAQMASSNFQIHSSSLNSGGGQESSTSFSLKNSMGQPGPVGISQSSNFGLFAGFQSTALEEIPQWIPRIRVSEDFLDWGEVTIGHASDRVLTIHNDGLGTLEVTDISCDNPEFSVSPDEMTVAGLGSYDVTITFTPTAEGTFEATLTLSYNDSEQPELLVQLYGVGIAGCTGGEVGDVNGDESINVLDVLAVVNHILDNIPLDENGQCRSDCNGDDSVDILDALGIVNVILGIGECVPGAVKVTLTPQAMDFLASLESYLSTEHFAKFMALVKSVQIPAEYHLAQNYPNPFNPTTSIQYSVVSDQSPPHITLKIYNILGQEVRILVDELKEPGYYTVTWDGKDYSGREVASGIYFYRLTVDGGQWSATKRMVLMK